MTEENIKRPAYDARQKFYDDVMASYANAKIYASLRDHWNWYMELHHIFTRVSPWMKSEDRDKIKNELLRIRKLIVGVQSLSTQRSNIARNIQGSKSLNLEMSLLDLQGDLFLASKHMMLPEGSDDSYKEWDEDRFLEESS